MIKLIGTTIQAKLSSTPMEEQRIVGERRIEILPWNTSTATGPIGSTRPRKTMTPWIYFNLPAVSQRLVQKGNRVPRKTANT